jgi:toxin ParE1/3/4
MQSSSRPKQRTIFSISTTILPATAAQSALGYIARIEKSCMSLQTLPERGTLREDLRPGLRVMGFERRVLTAFRVNSDSVAILRILYGGRSVELAFPQTDK